MSKMLKTAGIVVAAVALVAMTAGAAAPAVVGSATAAASAGGIAGVSAATLTAIGAYGGLAASVLTAAASATAPGVTSQGTATKFQTNPQSGLPYAMGRTRMSGLRFFAATNTRPGYTKFNDLLWFGALLSIGGPIGGIEKFTADGEVVTFDASGNAVGNFHDYMAQKVHLGGPMSTALNLSLGGGTAPGWTAQHKLSGITHAMWCLRYNKQGEMYGAGAPEPAWIGKWVKVYDPRLDSTYPGGSGPCRALDETTYVWSDNPGLHALTWALGRWQNGERTCGIGAPVETIRMAEFVECANVCETNGWTVGGVEWTTDSKWDSLKRILQAGGARPTQTAAMIGCLVNMPRTAIATIESRHLHDGLSLAATKSRRERISSVIPRYVDEDSDWELISGTAITVAEYATADKGKRTKEIDFPLVQVFSGQEAKQPGQLAAYEIVNSREAGPWTFTTGPEWIGLKTGDVVYLNVPEEGLVNQPVMITRRAIDPSTGKVSFAVETETYAKHAFALGETTTPPAPWTPTAPDLKPPAPVETEWTVTGTTSGEGFPALLVAGESEMPSADAIVIDYRLHSGNETATAGWTNSAILSAADAVRHVIAPLESQTPYDVRVSYRVESIDGDTTIYEQVTTGVGKITTIENQLEDQDAALAQLDTDIGQATINIAAAQATIAQMQTDAVATKAELEADIASLNATADQIQTDAAGTRAALVTAQADILAAGGRINTIESTLGDQGASITSLSQTVSNHTGRLASIDTTLTANGASINQNAQAISAVQGDLASLSSTVGTQGASITQNAQAISTANQNIASLSATVSAHTASISQNAQAISTVQGDVASLSTTVSAHTASISQNAQAISTTQGNLATLSSTVTSQGSSITQLQTASSTQAGDIATLKTRIVAGGGNLLTNTEFATGLTGWVTFISGQTGVNFGINGAGSTYQVDGTNAATIQQTNTSNTGYSEIKQVVPGEPGKIYEISTWYGAHRCLASLYAVAVDNAGNSLGQVGSLVNLPQVLTNRNSISGWSRVAFKTSAAPTGTAFIHVFLRKMATSTGTTDSWVWFLRPQIIETTSDTPSPQRYAAGTERASIELQATALSTINTQYASLSSTVSTQGSSISTMQTAITSLQGDTATLKTQIQVGGGNLLTNTEFAGGLTGWNNPSGTIGSLTSYSVNGAGTAWQIPGTNAATMYYSGTDTAGYSDLTQIVPIIGGRYYDFSVWAAAHRCQVQFYLQFRNASGGLTNTASSGLITPTTGGTSYAGWGNRYSFKGLADPTATTVMLYMRKFGSLAGQTDSWAWFMKPQLVETTAAQAPNVPYAPGDNRASIESQAAALSTLSTQYASLSSTVSTQGVTITNQQTAITSINGNITSLMGRWGVEIDVNGYVSGVTTNNNGTRADFTIRADKFAIVSPGGGARTEYSNGNWRVYNAAGVLKVQWGVNI